MDLKTFLSQRRPDWRRLEEILRHVEGSGLAVLSEDQTVEFGQLYRRTASDLNQAQTFVSGEATVQYLNDLVARCYLVIYSKTKVQVGAVLRHLIFGFPAMFRRYLGYFLLSLALFVFGTIFGLLASHFDKDAARTYLLPEAEHLIQPGREGPVMDAGELAGFSSFLFTHNITVTLAAYALGMTLGIATVWVMFATGVQMGALMAVFWEAGELRSFATGILPHGVLEIPAALLGGAAGFVLAKAIIRARPWPRIDELARAGKESLLLVSGCFPLLIVAGVLEAGVARAPDQLFSSGFKLTIAGIFAIVFIVYTLLLGWKKAPVSAGQSASGIHAA